MSDSLEFRLLKYIVAVAETFAIYAGTVICFGGLIFAGIRMLSGRFQDAIPGSIRRSVRCRCTRMGRGLDQNLISCMLP